MAAKNRSVWHFFLHHQFFDTNYPELEADSTGLRVQSPILSPFEIKCQLQVLEYHTHFWLTSNKFKGSHDPLKKVLMTHITTMMWSLT